MEAKTINFINNYDVLPSSTNFQLWFVELQQPSNTLREV